MTQRQGLYIALFSVHGLVRSRDIELGRDADTGGQVLYVVELARHLARHPHVDRVDLFTRQVIDPKVSDDYAQAEEVIEDGARIVRLPCGPRRYLRKEVLWPHLYAMADRALQYFSQIGRVPDLVHAHYADAGFVAARLTDLVGVPMAFTGHSLGREKRRRLEAQGLKKETIESQYNMSTRIEAEEIALEHAAMVIASTQQEVDEQYRQYENYEPERMTVIPPGVDLSRFQPPSKASVSPQVRAKLKRFLEQFRKPAIMAMSRADYRKNLTTLVTAYGESPELQELANLFIIAGNREDIREMDKGAREVLTELLLLIDRYDLYGKVAYPKQHTGDEAPEFYRVTAELRGVFCNPALTEPFGLTLLEAAASGLPVVATEDGGPRDIIGACKNGILVDPLDKADLTQALLKILKDGKYRERLTRAGLNNVHREFSWSTHVKRYLKLVDNVLDQQPLHARRRRGTLREMPKSRIPSLDRMIVCDLDGTLLGDAKALKELMDRIQTTPGCGLGLTSGRSIDSVLEVLKEWEIPQPDVLLTSAGTEIYYGRPRLREDASWQRHIYQDWQPMAIHEAMRELEGIHPQPEEAQRPFKLSYFIDTSVAPNVMQIKRHLRQRHLHANVIRSYRMFLDVLPIRASKGLALRYFAMKWGLPLDRILVAGDSGNDAEMLRGQNLAVVVANYSQELARLRGASTIYFAEGAYARGILEGAEHYDFFGNLRIPEADKVQEQ